MTVASAKTAPLCLICQQEPTLLYKATIDADSPMAQDEFSCTSPHVGEHTDIYLCSKCQLAFAEPIESEYLHQEYEQNIDEVYLAEEEQRLYNFDKILKDIEKSKKPGTLLEIGSMVGLMLKAAEKRGWEAQGLEPSKWAVEFGKKQYGVNLRQGTLETTEYPAHSFDCIVMVDVLEHLADPLVILPQLLPWLKPDGVLALSTVNINTLARRVLGTKWPWFMRMHLFYFTPKSLTLMLEKNGYIVHSIKASPRTFRLNYLGTRFSQGGFLKRMVARVARLPLLGQIPLTVRTKDLVLVIASPAGNN